MKCRSQVQKKMMFLLGVVGAVVPATASLGGPIIFDPCWFLMSSLQTQQENIYNDCEEDRVNFKFTGNDGENFEVFYVDSHFTSKLSTNYYKQLRASNLTLLTNCYKKDGCNVDSPYSIRMTWLPSRPNRMSVSLRNEHTGENIFFTGTCSDGMVVAQEDNTSYAISFRPSNGPDCID